MIKVMLRDDRAVVLEAGAELMFRIGEDETLSVTLDGIAEFRFGEAEVLVVSGRNASGTQIRALALADEETGVMVVSPPLSPDATKQLADELAALAEKPVVETFQALPDGL